MLQIAEDSQDVSVETFAVDALSGLPRAGLTFADVNAHYVRNRSAGVAISLGSLAGPTAGHVDGGFAEIDAAGAPGWYRLDVPDAAFASGASTVTIVPQADGVLFSPVRVQLGGSVSSTLSDEVHLCKAALVNKRVHVVSTGVDQIKDDDGVTTLVTMTPQDGGDDVVEVVPS